MSKAVAIGLFLALLVVAAAFGIARDLYSNERAQLKSSVVAIKPIGQDYKSSLIRPPNLTIRLEDGRTVDVTVTDTTGIATGATVSVAEMVMPWGQVWYRLKQ
jgi:hypothetical protein